ncbi:hypothetical protein VTO42DRAFT_8204 [Malbranchea cinnamomea]
MASTLVPQALTTPFVQPSECASLWDLTSIPSLVDGSTTTVTVLASDEAHERFASCQPSGWDSTGDGFTFSPAVCPSHWTYYAMASTESVVESGGRGVSTYSTAYCCASGHKLRTDLTDFPISTLVPLCYRQIAADDSTTLTVTPAGESSGVPFTQGIQVHQAWHISWAESDTSTLTPSLPELTSSKLVPTWTPGQTIPPGMYDRESGSNDGPRGLGGVVWFLMIGIPIIGVVLIALAVWFCIRHRRAKREQRERRAAMDAALLDGK